MDAAAVRGIARTAREFSLRHVAPMVAEEGRDGDLAKLGAVLDEAEAIGLMASPDSTAPGYEYGVWGAASLEDGPTASLVMLEEVARVCGGVACCLHAAGLGTLEVLESGIEARRVAVALFEDGRRVGIGESELPLETSTSIESRGDGAVLRGVKPAVHAVPGWAGCVLYATGEMGWQRFFVGRESDAVEVMPCGRRMGLNALEMLELRLSGVPLSAEYQLEPRSPWSFLRRHLLGIAAIAVGNARGAVDAAYVYTEGRYQGGDQIENQPAVQNLIGDAASRVAASAAFLERVAAQDDDSGPALMRAAAAKLRITVDCCEAVTDCLQVFGGYGYMEDYGLEKRLRDAMTLKTLSIRPDELRQLLASAGFGGGR